MAGIDWRISGPSLDYGHCDIACPCPLDSRPMHYDCRPVTAVRIGKGRRAEVDLAGIGLGTLPACPGAIRE